MRKTHEKGMEYVSPSVRFASLHLLQILCTSKMSGITEDLLFCDDADLWFQGTEDMEDGYAAWF